LVVDFPYAYVDAHKLSYVILGKLKIINLVTQRKWRFNSDPSGPICMACSEYDTSNIYICCIGASRLWHVSSVFVHVHPSLCDCDTGILN